MKAKILIQLDTDPLPSLFDRIVAVDAGADHVFAHGGITPDMVEDLVYGAIFTRGPEDLRFTAIFIGGSDIARGEELLDRARRTFLGKLRVSLMLDSGGANTTAAAAVVSVERRLELQGRHVLVLGATGSVGQRVVRLLTRSGARVRVGSRSMERAESAVEAVTAHLGSSPTAPRPFATGSGPELKRALDGVEAVVSAGGAGVTLLPASARREAKSLRVLVDLNAVPPAGIEGVSPIDNGKDLEGGVALGAIAVGGVKMKIHKASLARLFEHSGNVLDADEILEIGRAMGSGK